MRNRTEDQVMLAWIRHGATRANQEHRYLGRTDEPLSEEGREALLSCQSRNLYPDVSYLFTSPLKRCLETAHILYPDLSPTIIPEWREMDFGRFEYKNYMELKNDAQYQAWVDSGGTLAFPEGESREEFIARCEKGFIRMCNELRQEAGRRKKESFQTIGESAKGPVAAGIIVHGGTIMAFMSRHGGKDYFDCQAANGRGYMCRMTGWGSGAQIGEVTAI